MTWKSVESFTLPETNSEFETPKSMGLEGEFPFGISIIFKGKRAVSFQGWCISMYFPNLHHPSRSTILKNGRLLGGKVFKVFFQATKDTSLHFQPPPPPRKMGNLFIEVTLCLYKGCSIPTSRIIVTSHEFRILLIDQPVFRVVLLHVRGQLV